eukprot:gb/GFBE01013982.1/.p1 GENE.gb/GFBE01013982.1/~~gb/GFBE01013982.1/.p1  ORF type:complete len:384 (+),score=79.36 gb/GFBE01013982.1/:1-1152(+)
MEANAELEDGMPKDLASWWPDGSGVDMTQEWSQNAAHIAAFQADVAAKHAQTLAQWTNHLWRQIAVLQRKVDELEDWKKKTLDDMSRLRFEHKVLRRQVYPDGLEEEQALPSKAKSLPLLLADHVDVAGAGSKTSKGKKAGLTPVSAASMRPPPGLEAVFDKSDANGAKQVRFAAPTGEAVALQSARLASEPGLGVRSEASGLSDVSITTASSFMTGDSTVTDDGPLEGIHVSAGTTADGIPCQTAEWRIGHLSTKLKGCMGRALVSSPFSAFGLEDLRLMVFPDGKEPVKGPRSRRQKELYTKKVTEGPLEGCLKLKVPECPPPHIVEYFLHIGSVRCGPFKHNFGENTVNGCLDFGIDWLKQVEPDQSLMVKVEILGLPEA